MKILVLLGLSAVLTALPVSAFPTPQEETPPQCVDPTFACQDLQSARLCRVVKTCIHDVWSYMRVPDSNDEVCDICKEMVKEARDQLLSNMTQEEIKEVFEGSCKLIPIKLVADACIKVVDEIIPQLVEMLASRMDPTVVCTVSGMCFSTSGENSIQHHIFKLFRAHLLKQTDAQCDECTKMMTDVQEFLKLTSEDEVKTDIEKLCHEKLSEYLCNIIVKSYFSEIYNYIISSTPDQLCSTAGVCPKSTLQNEQSKVHDELTCEFCEHVLQHVKDLITANTTVEEFRTALLNFCNHTGSFSDKCTSFVNDYFDTLFSYIKNLDTKGMCTLMGLCDSSQHTRTPMVKVFPAFEMKRKIPLIKLRPAEQINANDIDLRPLVRVFPATPLSKKEMTESNDIFQTPQLPIERIIHPLPVYERDMECAMCKAFSLYLEKETSGDKSKNGVRNAINGICVKWMKDYPEHCNRIVNNYSMKMQFAIAKGTEFQELCSMIKVCPLEEKETHELKVEVLKSMMEDNVLCDLCEDAMKELEDQLSDPATKQKLKDLFGQACSILPKSLKDDCTKFVNENIDAVIDMLQQELKPDVFCPEIGLCPQKTSVTMRVPQRVMDLECNLCKDVVTSLRQKLQDPALKVIVKTFLEEGCIRLPESISSQCKKFVDENIDTLMTLIIDELDPEKVCAILKVCPVSVVKVEKSTENLKDVECEICQKIVDQLQALIKDQKTIDEIEKALELVCGLLPSSISDKCDAFIKKYAEVLINLLIEGVDPHMICSILQFCPESSAKVYLVPDQSSDVECDLCKQVVTQVLDMVKDKKTEDEIKNALDKVCTYLPSSLTQKCESFVNQYTDLLISLLIQEADPDTVCAALGLCKGSVVKVQKVIEQSSDLDCDLCKQVVTQVVNMIKDQKTEEEIKNALDKVCTYLPSSLTTKCENFVNQYTDLLISLLIQEADPDTVCAALGVCKASGVKVEKVPEKLNDVDCDLCKQVVTQVINMIKDQKTEEEIKNALDKVCTYLPASLTQKCEKFVNQYTDLLISLLIQEADPDTVCAALGICKASVTLEEAPTKLKDLECDLCKEVVTQLEDMIKDQKTEEEIQKALDKVCSYLPSSLATRCENFVNEYTKTLILLLSQDIDKDMICAALKLCPEKAHFAEWQSKAKDLECESCQYVLHFIQQQLMNTDTQVKVKDVLKKMCDVLPKTYATNCEAFVDEYGDSLLVLVAQEIDPSTMCYEVKLCKNTTSILEKYEHVEVPALSPFRMDECSVCTTVVDYLDKLLEEDDVDKEITQLVEKVCTVVPSSFRNKCSTVLEAYGPYILQMIGQLADSREICQDIDFCPRTPGQVHLIGGSKCTFGPSYWCKSTAHASACKADEFCKEKVWKN